MNKSNKVDSEIQALRERLSRLSTAVLCVNSSLDLDTVLDEILTSTRDLVGARYGVITTIDETGQPQDFVTSGFSPDEERLLMEWEPALRFFEHLRDLPGPLRLADVPAYIRSIGYAPHPMLPKTFQSTPMRHRGVHVGTFFLGKKQGGHEFTDKDEEVLVLFASQAAAAIANARTHRDEQRARSSLEALVDTSPVGVVVFDAKTAQPVLLNREARRIVEGLRTPGRRLEQLLEVITCRSSDGREVALAEFPMKRVIDDAVTVRAEEVVLSVPDGRRITMLINCTPIHSDAGAVESMIVTMQDLAPFQELNRLRTEFLGMVSHELRAPLAAVKGSAATVLGSSRVLDRTEMQQFFRIIEVQADHMDNLISDLLDAGRIDSGMLSVDCKPVQVAELVEQARTTFLSGGGRQTIRIDLPLDLPRVMADEQRIVQVLNNLFSNASLHAPESSVIHVGAVRDGVHVVISVTDEGQGVSPEQLPYLFRKYTGDGDRPRGVGLGLAICKGLVEAHGGRIRAENAGPGRGTRFTFTIPLVEEAGHGAMEASTHRRRADQRKPLILAVDDDPQFLGLVRATLNDAGFRLLTTGDPNEVSDLIDEHSPHLALLDLLLPEMDGIELMQKVPALTDRPVIFLSAYGRDETVARALEMGAVDYIVKPFSPTELVARIQTALRKSDAFPEIFQSGALVINYEKRRVSLHEVPLELTATEYDLLRILSTNAGRVVTYEILLRNVWRLDKVDGTDGRRRIRAFVKKLRDKLGDDPSNPTYIFTESRVGYRMHRPDDAPETQG
ncbi:MAG: response regulator [Rhodothermaceae bacterium]|nr:response regulator [Rhodothermaceae bacterium]MYH13110.1 response regulator [Rhodothermaceae bacterium]MYK62629.1 response regulator [Rhodothermaceae bacterium]